MDLSSQVQRTVIVKRFSATVHRLTTQRSTLPTIAPEQCGNTPALVERDSRKYNVNESSANLQPAYKNAF
jgi:hypothetical protein